MTENSMIEDGPSRSPLTISIIAVTLTAAVVAGLYARAGINNEGEQKIPLTVQATKVERSEQLIIDRWYAGRVEPTQQVLIASELAGRVEQVFVNEGDVVLEGDTLVALDTSLLTAERKRLISSLSGLEAQRALAKRRLERQSGLRVDGFSAEDTIDEIQTNLKLLDSQQKTLLADIERLDIQLEKSVIKAPFDASIQKRFVDVGAVIDPGAALIDLMESGTGEIKVGVPVESVRLIQIGSKLDVTVRDTVEQATIVSIAPAVDPATQTVAIRLLLQGTAFRFGEFVNVKLARPEDISGFWVPNTALVEDERGLWNLFTIDDDNIVKKYSASIIHADSQQVFVDVGGYEGLNVVVSGLNRIAPGMQVQL